MLVLTRQAEQDICIGPNIRVRVLSVQGGQVRLGIEAPADVPIHRGELLDRVREENVAALTQDSNALRGLKQAARLVVRHNGSDTHEA